MQLPAVPPPVISAAPLIGLCAARHQPRPSAGAGRRGRLRGLGGGRSGGSLRQDGLDYFDTHHTADDTLDKVDPQQLARPSQLVGFHLSCSGIGRGFQEPRTNDKIIQNDRGCRRRIPERTAGTSGVERNGCGHQILQ